MLNEPNLPRSSDFMAAGLDLSVYLEIKKRWPVMTDEEKQLVARRVVPLRKTPLDELLEPIRKIERK